jgi:hypothetical protein
MKHRKRRDGKEREEEQEERLLEKGTVFITREGRPEINCPECSQAVPFHPSDKGGLEIKQITEK